MRDSLINFIKTAETLISFQGKTVLEVGCGNGEMLKEIAVQYKPEMIIGIDPKVPQSQQGDKWKIEQGNIITLNYPNNFFDAVISVATLEHISDINGALCEIKRILKPYGKLYLSFGPIWSSIVGHHFLLGDEEWAKIIPAWGHLWMDKNEMLNYLQPLVGEEKAEKACSSIYDCKRLNRLVRKDYYDAFINSGLWIRFIQENISLSRLNRFGIRESEYTAEIYSKLRDKFQPQDLSVMGMTVLLEKYANL